MNELKILLYKTKHVYKYYCTQMMFLQLSNIDFLNQFKISCGLQLHCLLGKFFFAHISLPNKYSETFIYLKQTWVRCNASYVLNYYNGNFHTRSALCEKSHLVESLKSLEKNSENLTHQLLQVFCLC